MKELIEKLKDKNYVRAFYLIPIEEQEALLKAGWKNRVVLAASGWRDDFDNIPGRERCHLTYAIKPDYKSEPEFVDLEIIEFEQDSGKWLGVFMDPSTPVLPYQFTHLHCLPGLPNFNCFWEENKGDNGYMLNRAFWTFGLVSPKIYEGKKVYARFRL